LAELVVVVDREVDLRGMADASEVLEHSFRQLAEDLQGRRYLTDPRCQVGKSCLACYSVKNYPSVYQLFHPSLHALHLAKKKSLQVVAFRYLFLVMTLVQDPADVFLAKPLVELRILFSAMTIATEETQNEKELLEIGGLAMVSYFGKAQDHAKMEDQATESILTTLKIQSPQARAHLEWHARAW
jgi:hypothetical protein